ncbi:DJ-1/PfpI family protein [Methylocystis sp. MJC1]|jgi:cyclohexyl-isocyanide hydratase|uniref:DJ-1/PfpI family protein n=1 Tax=Methylocystis sp. MJC1 TaxID=2654282 RepID=UPI0013EC6FF9|nr:DJ-1/PfpI family protein [Methylocystis sp. MJC1]KAF2990389.1 Isonitrile hydratase [Methylocystis sp. MJC1]MBU6528182.1 DJ-1/PfpI family protein [Methylocystis sp. MJC1]UZX11093.1 DJ-1/PfpI family protein [Methylocystis sp. MJC1]
MPILDEKFSVPSIEKFRAMISPEGVAPLHVGIVIGPGFVPMDMVGIQTVFGLMPGTEIHLVWKSLDLVEGFPSWWTKPTTTFADCPDLDVIAVPMLPPEILNDAEAVEFVAAQGRRARCVIGICYGVLMLGAAGLLRNRRVTSSHNALPILSHLGAAEVVQGGAGVVVDGNLYTAGPGVGSFEAALLAVERIFGRSSAEFAEWIIEYDPHPPFGTGNAIRAQPLRVSQSEALMADITFQYSHVAVEAFAKISRR